MFQVGDDQLEPRDLRGKEVRLLTRITLQPSLATAESLP